MTYEINRLRRQARNALTTFRRIGESYDCGSSMLQEVSHEAARAASDFNAAMTRLAAIDPNCPPWKKL